MSRATSPVTGKPLWPRHGLPGLAARPLGCLPPPDARPRRHLGGVVRPVR